MFALYLIMYGCIAGMAAEGTAGTMMGAAMIYMAVDFLLRFIVQTTPGMMVKPYILQPISRYTAIECFLVGEHVSGYNFLWLKFRPDTPQCYEYVLAENITGKTANFLNINPWTQFYDIKGRKDLPVSRGDNITDRNCRFECDTYFNVKADEEHYHLSNITLEDLEVTAADIGFDASAAEDLTVRNVRLVKKDGVEYPDSVTTI